MEKPKTHGGRGREVSQWVECMWCVCGSSAKSAHTPRSSTLSLRPERQVRGEGGRGGLARQDARGGGDAVLPKSIHMHRGQRCRAAESSSQREHGGKRAQWADILQL